MLRVLIEAILMGIINKQLLCRKSEKKYRHLLPNNPQWLELPMSRTNFHGPKDVRAIEVLLYIVFATRSRNDRPEQTCF